MERENFDAYVEVHNLDCYLITIEMIQGTLGN